MVRLNRHELEQIQLDKLLNELSKTVSNLPTERTDHFLSELLGREERIMLAKRLAIIVLLLEKYSLYEIGIVLKVSPMTARSLKQKLDRGELSSVIHEISKSNKLYQDLFSAIDSILHLGGALPHYKAHRGRR